MKVINKRGFTITELIITITIIGIIAAVAAGIFISFIQGFIGMEHYPDAAVVAQEVLNAAIEGEPGKFGIRFSHEVLAATEDTFEYSFGYPLNSDKRNMRIRYDAGTKKIYRSYTPFGDIVNGVTGAYGAEEDLLPYYAQAVMSIEERAGYSIFSYYKMDASGNEMAWSPTSDHLYDIKRVEINIVVRSLDGTDSFTTTTSIDIKQYI